MRARSRRTPVGLAEEAGHTGWWHAYSDSIPKEFSLFVGLEEAAKRLFSYQSTLLPGLLQTEEYRRALTWIDFPICLQSRSSGVSNCSPAGRPDWTVPQPPSHSMRSWMNPQCAERLVDVRSWQISSAGLAGDGEHQNLSVRVVAAQCRGLLRVEHRPVRDPRVPEAPDCALVEPPVIYMQIHR